VLLDLDWIPLRDLRIPGYTLSNIFNARVIIHQGWRYILLVTEPSRDLLYLRLSLGILQ